VLCDASEFDELPVRHNEEHVNLQMSKELPWRLDERTMDSPHTKANLLLQAHFARTPLPMSDYVTDTKSVLDQAIRVLNAMVDIAADGGWLFTALGIMHLTQMVTQGRWMDESPLLDLPGMNERGVRSLAAKGVAHLPQLMLAEPSDLRRWLGGSLSEGELSKLLETLRTLPAVRVEAAVQTEKLVASTDGVVRVRLESTQPGARRNVLAPRFPKARMAGGWWLALGEEDELHALRRVHFERGSMSTELQFSVPDEPGEYTFDVHLVSDSYIGLDQQLSVAVVVPEENGRPDA